MELRVVPPWMSHEPMFQISTEFVEEIQSYWSTSVGYQIWVLMVVRENDLKCSLMFWVNYSVTIEFQFTYLLLYNPPFSTLWASFAPFSFGESERSLGVRVLLEIFERREDLVWVFKIFNSIKVCWVRNFFLSMKTQTSQLFSQQKELFHQLQNFFFHWTPWDTLFHLGLKKHIFTWISWKTSQNSLKHGSSWSYMKISSYEVMLLFVFCFWFKFHHPQMILVVQPVCQVCEFTHLLNSYSHEKQKSSKKTLKLTINLP